MDHSHRRPPSRPDRSRTPTIHFHLTCTCRLSVRPRHPGAMTLRSDVRRCASRQRLLAWFLYRLAGIRILLPASPLMDGGGNAGARPLRHAAREGAEAVALPSARNHRARSPFVIEMKACASTSERGNHATGPSQDQISAAPDNSGRPAHHQPQDSADLVSRIGVVHNGPIARYAQYWRTAIDTRVPMDSRLRTQSG